MESDWLAWSVLLAGVFLIGMAAAAEIALSAVDRSAVRRRSEAGEARAQLLSQQLTAVGKTFRTSGIKAELDALAWGQTAIPGGISQAYQVAAITIFRDGSGHAPAFKILNPGHEAKAPSLAGRIAVICKGELTAKATPIEIAIHSKTEGS